MWLYDSEHKHSFAVDILLGNPLENGLKSDAKKRNLLGTDRIPYKFLQKQHFPIKNSFWGSKKEKSS